MTGPTPGRVVRVLWLAMALLWLGGITLLAIDLPSTLAFAFVIGLPIAVYGFTGGLVARRRPENPIGWLFCGVALALGLWLFGLTYAQAGLGGRPGLSAAPGAALAGWVGTLVSVAVLPTALPVFLLYFPDGRLRSARWRAALAVVVSGGLLMLLGAAAKVANFSGTTRLRAPEPVTRIPGAGGFWAVGFALVIGASFAGLVALVLRFRSASPDERQSLRLVVGMIVAMAIATAIALVAWPAAGGTEWLWVFAVLAALVDAFGLLIGIPVATGAAVVTYGLYDVGVVVKKTVVYVLLVVFFLLTLGLVGLLLSPLALIGTQSVEQDGGEIASRIVSAISVFVIALLLLFRPVKRLARRLVYGKRSTRYEAMGEFSERLGETYSTEDVLPRMAEIVRASTGADVARVWLHLGGALRSVAVAPSNAPAVEPLYAPADELPDMGTLRAFPIRDRGELLGALTVSMPAAEPLSKDGQRLVVDLASQARLVVSNVRLIEELRESRRRIVSAQDERAKKLERNIHDGAQQQLVALAVKQRLAAALVGKDEVRLRAMLEELQNETNQTLEDLRDLARGIYPPILADKGLPAAIKAQVSKSTLPTTMNANGVGRYQPEVEAAVYFSVLEALQNILKYAEASSARVALEAADGVLEFEVTDDGKGFDLTMVERGTGLHGMADRIEAIGGFLEVNSSPAAGTTVRGRVPVEVIR